MAQKIVKIYSDGACSGNPGPGGWGAIVCFDKKVYELGGSESATTNNRMELKGPLESLRFLSTKKVENSKLVIYTDSVYVIRGITQWIFGWKKRGWKNAENESVSNQDLWQELHDEVQLIQKKLQDKIEWKFVKGHEGVPGNERCDQIAVGFSKREYVELYSGPEAGYIFDVNQEPPDRPLPEMKGKSESSNKPAWYISLVNGVFSKHATWKECEALVKGRAAKFKKVTSETEEAEVKKSWGL